MKQPKHDKMRIVGQWVTEEGTAVDLSADSIELAKSRSLRTFVGAAKTLTAAL
jgi:hypothetical protein